MKWNLHNLLLVVGLHGHMKKLVLTFAFFATTAAFAQETPLTPVETSPETPSEQTLAPLLDLHSGGQASGAAQGSGATQGALIDGTLLPANGDGFQASKSETSRWGAGIMTSMIVNSAPVLAYQFPGTVLRVGGIAQQFGGPYKPHKSHQNGLDADFYFVGMNKYESVLDSAGAVTEKLEIEKNWFYWRLIASQQIQKENRQGSAVSMILVDPRIKTFLCSWAEARKSALDELDYEVLSLLRPTEGHDDHFHVRLHCSPAYSSCIDQGFAPKKRKTGCANLDAA
jgi:penicillin-insensitive murein DD-endopeptidase